MANIADSKPKNGKYDPPEGSTPDWIIQQIYKDVKELKEVWCPRVQRIEGILVVVCLVCAIYTLTHAQQVIDGFGAWAGIK